MNESFIEKKIGRPRKYTSDLERFEAYKNYNTNYYSKNKETVLKKQRERYFKNNGGYKYDVYMKNGISNDNNTISII
jgi:hypothetical protein